jgi:nucleotide-binding universal stress UspA family protein
MYRDILLAVDLTDNEAQTKAANAAFGLAKTHGARLHVMTVVPDFGLPIVSGYFPKDYEKDALSAADKALHAFVASFATGLDGVQHIVAHGTIYKEILAYADKTGCDLIVMASHRPELSDYLLGPNAARVVRHARVSVLVVRGTEQT